ncbi:MAG: hypothetical protein FWD63_06705 [Propionibacteriaceae bacterium]|nr:hypothetical protein [Propionibacteriaceae bacterium]
MAKDKTKPRADLAPRREIAAKQEAEKTAKRRRQLAINWAIAIVIIALVAAGIWGARAHVKAGEREIAITGPANAAQITPPNASSDGLAIIVKADEAAAFSPSLPIPTPAPSDTPTDTPTDTPSDTPSDMQGEEGTQTDAPSDPPTDTPSSTPTVPPNPSGPYIVDFYVDFQSFSSSGTQTTYGPALTALAGKGDITLRYHFLTNGDTTNTNTASSRTAIAAACADTVGKFLPYTQAALAATPISITSGALVFGDQKLKVEFPATAGITGDDLKTFQNCYTQRATRSFISTMSIANQTTAVPGNSTYASGVTSTPVMVVASPDTPTVFQTVDLSTDMYSDAPSTSEDALLALIATTAYGLTDNG